MTSRKLDGSETISEAKEFIHEMLKPLLRDLTDKAAEKLEASYERPEIKRAFYLEIRIHWDLQDRRDWL